MASKTIPFLDLAAQHGKLEDELIAAARASIREARFIGGPEVESFEREFADYCGTKFCVGVGSGTDAVRFALMAAGVRSGDAVVTVAHTFIATVEGISQAGADTEFVDIDERTYNMSPQSLATHLETCRIDSSTGRPLGHRTGKPIRAVVPVHLYGQVADMDAITEIAEKYGLMVIEDACQAHGAEYLGIKVRGRAGALATAAAFSFYPGKNLGACGEAGAVTTNDAEIANRIRMIRDHGQAQKYHHVIEGYNGRLDALQAAFLRVKLRHLDTWNEQRRAAAQRYSKMLDPLPGVLTPYEPSWSQAVYHLYVVRTRERDTLAKALNASGIQTGFHYPVPLHHQDCYANWDYAKGSLPITERVASEIVSLPMYPGLTSEQQKRVASEIAAVMQVPPNLERDVASPKGACQTTLQS
jgi:dTDP-4-amino-4,6-dideoxygalactose transaminase